MAAVSRKTFVNLCLILSVYLSFCGQTIAYLKTKLPFTARNYQYFVAQVIAGNTDL